MCGSRSVGVDEGEAVNRQSLDEKVEPLKSTKSRSRSILSNGQNASFSDEADGQALNEYFITESNAFEGNLQLIQTVRRKSFQRQSDLQSKPVPVRGALFRTKKSVCLEIRPMAHILAFYGALDRCRALCRQLSKDAGDFFALNQAMLISIC